MHKILIYDTEEQALAKANEEGKAQGLPYHSDPTQVTRYAGALVYTSDNKVALYVNGFTTLTPEEESLIVNTID